MGKSLRTEDLRETKLCSNYRTRGFENGNSVHSRSPGSDIQVEIHFLRYQNTKFTLFTSLLFLDILLKYILKRRDFVGIKSCLFGQGRGAQVPEKLSDNR